MEYYSVGGGFIQWKGWTPPERGKPVHPYGTMRQLREQLAKTGLTLHELILDNESAITGMSRPDIFQNLEQIMESMYASVRRGLEAEGQLPGTLGVWRKGHTLLERAREMPLAVDRFLGPGQRLCLCRGRRERLGRRHRHRAHLRGRGRHARPALRHALQHEHR